LPGGKGGGLGFAGPFGGGQVLPQSGVFLLQGDHLRLQGGYLGLQGRDLAAAGIFAWALVSHHLEQSYQITARGRKPPGTATIR